MYFTFDCMHLFSLPYVFIYVCIIVLFAGLQKFSLPHIFAPVRPAVAAQSLSMHVHISMHQFIHSFILDTYITPLQEATTQRRSQPSHGQKRRTSERCKIWKGGPSARNAAQRGDHSMLMDPQPKMHARMCFYVCLFLSALGEMRSRSGL